MIHAAHFKVMIDWLNRDLKGIPPKRIFATIFRSTRLILNVLVFDDNERMKGAPEHGIFNNPRLYDFYAKLSPLWG